MHQDVDQGDLERLLEAHLRTFHSTYGRHARAFMDAGFQTPEELATVTEADVPANLKGAVRVITRRSAQAGTAAAEIQRLTEEMQKLKHLPEEVERLKLQVQKASHTTRTYQNIGQDVLRTAEVAALCLPSAPHHTLVAACNAVLVLFQGKPRTGALLSTQPEAGTGGERSMAAHQQEPGAMLVEPGAQAPAGAAPAAALPPPVVQLGSTPTSMLRVVQVPALSAPLAPPVSSSNVQPMSLLDAVWPVQRAEVREEEHMQPAMMAVLRAVGGAVSCRMQLRDTHASSQLRYPTSKPDCTGLAGGVEAWSQVVTHFEFKLGKEAGDREVMLGQLIQRCAAALDAQNWRRKIFAVGVTMDTLEVLQVIKQPDDGGLRYLTTGPHPFFIGTASTGFAMLAQLLTAPLTALGFQPPPAAAPIIGAIGGFHLSTYTLLRSGSAARHSSHVFHVLASPGGKAMALKLNQSTREEEVLSRLKGVGHIVQMVGRCSCNYDDDAWTALLLEPFVEHLSHCDSLLVTTQVVYDVAYAIGKAGALGVVHRDVTPNNFGAKDGRGYLLDFSAAKVQEQDAGERPSPPGLHHITGTLQWAPYSALDGQRHSVSSDLEGLFTSVAYIAMDGRGWPGRSDGVGGGADLDSWRRRRLAQFGCRTIQSEDRVAPHLWPLVQALHGLFWPLAQGASVRSYRTDVSVVEVQHVCMSVAQEHCTAQLQPPHA